MKCPKCQCENIAKAEFCQECGNKLVIICPKCGFGQAYSEECVHCSIIFNKYKEHQFFKKKYKLKQEVFLFLKFIIVGFIILIGILIFWRNSAPAGIEAVAVCIVLCVMFGIVFILMHIRGKSYFVSISEKGLNIANKKMIPWEDIYNVVWHDQIAWIRGPINFPLRSLFIINLHYYFLKKNYV